MTIPHPGAHRGKGPDPESGGQTLTKFFDQTPVDLYVQLTHTNYMKGATKEEQEEAKRFAEEQGLSPDDITIALGVGGMFAEDVLSYLRSTDVSHPEMVLIFRGLVTQIVRGCREELREKFLVAVLEDAARLDAEAISSQKGGDA